MGGDHTSAASDNAGNVEFVVKVVKKLSLLLLIYYSGYFGQHFLAFTIFLVLIIDSVRLESKKERLQVAREFALGHEKEIILRSLPTLPAWVEFSDIEKVEWLNKLFLLLWEQVNGYVQDLLPKILEPAIQNHVSDFKFNSIMLGNVPLRVSGIKVYDPQDKRKIVMDLDIEYDGDCYVTFQTFKFTGGIKDIQLHGRLRVVLTPLIARIPLIGGIQAYFMTSPEIDFNLIKVTQIFDILGVVNRIKNTTKNVINSKLLYPNAYSINLSKGVNVSKLAAFRTEGILRVHVIEAKNLVNKDIIGKSDPYAVLQVGSIKVQTHVVHNCLNPKWDFWCEFEVVPNSVMKIEVWDEDDGPTDDFLGRGRVDISQVVKVGQMDMPIPLQNIEKGIIYLRLIWLPLSSNYSDLDTALKEIELLGLHLHTAILMIYLESSLNLPAPSKKEPNPFVKLEVEDQMKKTDAEQETTGPIWDKAFTFLLRNPKDAVLTIRVYDEGTTHSLGELSYEIDKLKDAPKMELQRQTFFFTKPYSEASICCSMKLRILKNEYVEEKKCEDNEPRKMLIKQSSSVSTNSKNKLTKQGSSVSSKSIKSDVSTVTSESENTFLDNETNTCLEHEVPSELGQIKLSLSYCQQRQRALVEIHEVNILEKSSHNFDPYVSLVLQIDKLRSVKKKTKTLKNTRNPSFNQQFDYLIARHDLSFSVITISVKSNGLFGKKFLGQTVIDLSQCDRLTEPFTDWFNLKLRKDTHMYHLDK